MLSRLNTRAGYENTREHKINEIQIHDTHRHCATHAYSRLFSHTPVPHHVREKLNHVVDNSSRQQNLYKVPPRTITILFLMRQLLFRSP